VDNENGMASVIYLLYRWYAIPLQTWTGP